MGATPYTRLPLLINNMVSGLFDRLAFLFRKKAEILRLHTFVGKHKPLGYQSAFEQFANSRGAARTC